MTNETEILTNAINVVTQSHLSITPEQVKYNFKEWMGVIDSVAASLYVAAHVAFPKLQAFMDSRDGGILQATFFKIFGKPKALTILLALCLLNSGCASWAPNGWNATVPTGISGKPFVQGVWVGISGPIPTMPWNK